MSKTAVITARIDEDTLALVDKVSKAHGRSRSWFASQAIRRLAEQEAGLLAFVQEGIDAADVGDVVPHDVVMAEIREMIRRQEARG